MRVRVCIENGKKRECVFVSLRERVRERESERERVRGKVYVTITRESMMKKNDCSILKKWQNR